MEIEIWKSNLNLKFEIRFKQKSKSEFYVLFFEKLKIDGKIRFLKGILGDVTDQRSASTQKRFREKTDRNTFFNFYWKSKFGFEIRFSIW